jgi:hypothetical protein
MILKIEWGLIVAALISGPFLVWAAYIQAGGGRTAPGINPTLAPSSTPTPSSPPTPVPTSPSTPAPTPEVSPDISGIWFSKWGRARYEITRYNKGYRFLGQNKDGVTAEGTVTLNGECFRVAYTTNRPSRVIVEGAVSDNAQQMSGDAWEVLPSFYHNGKPYYDDDWKRIGEHTFLRSQADGSRNPPIDIRQKVEECSERRSR